MRIWKRPLVCKTSINKKFKKTKKNFKINIMPKRKGDLVKVIASNKNLIKFYCLNQNLIHLNIMVKSSIKWEKKIS